MLHVFLNFWGGYMFIPFFAGLFNIRGPKQSYWASIVLGMVTFLLWQTYFEELTGIEPLFPAVFISFLGFWAFFATSKNKNSAVKLRWEGKSAA